MIAKYRDRKKAEELKKRDPHAVRIMDDETILIVGRDILDLIKPEEPPSGRIASPVTGRPPGEIKNPLGCPRGSFINCSARNYLISGTGYLARGSFSAFPLALAVLAAEADRVLLVAFFTSDVGASALMSFFATGHFLFTGSAEVFATRPPRTSPQRPDDSAKASFFIRSPPVISEL
jgi:hypothetical protein